MRKSFDAAKLRLETQLVCRFRFGRRLQHRKCGQRRLQALPADKLDLQYSVLQVYMYLLYKFTRLKYLAENDHSTGLGLLANTISLVQIDVGQLGTVFW